MEQKIYKTVVLHHEDRAYKVVIAGKLLPIGSTIGLYFCTFDDGQEATMVVQKNPVSKIYEGEPISDHPHRFLNALLKDAILEEFV